MPPQTLLLHISALPAVLTEWLVKEMRELRLIPQQNKPQHLTPCQCTASRPLQPSRLAATPACMCSYHPACLVHTFSPPSTLVQQQAKAKCCHAKKLRTHLHSKAKGLQHRPLHTPSWMLGSGRAGCTQGTGHGSTHVAPPAGSTKQPAHANPHCPRHLLKALEAPWVQQQHLQQPLHHPPAHHHCCLPLCPPHPAGCGSSCSCCHAGCCCCHHHPHQALRPQSAPLHCCLL